MTTFDVRLWCNECQKVIGVVRDVNPRIPRPVEAAMEEHAVTHTPVR